MSRLVELLVRELIAVKGLVVGREVRLRSGMVSRVYIDARRLLSSVAGRKVAALLLATKVAEVPGVEGVAGVATGGIAWAVLVAEALGLPAGYVRPEAKDHGLGRLVEGLEPSPIVLVDDVATTGSALEEAAKAARTAGFEVKAAVVLVDRCMGAQERLEKLGVEYRPVTTIAEVIRAAERLGVDTTPAREELEKLQC